MNRRALELFNLLLFVFAIVGTNIIDIFGLKVGQEQKIVVSIVVVVIYILVIREKKWEKIHSFKEKSKQFRSFFEEWYSKDGKLSIFCSDLDWLDYPDNAKIVDTLKRKGDKVRLYLRQDITEDKIANDLVAAGARYYKIKEIIRTSHRLSILDNDGIQSMIVRNKDINTDNIVFIETNSYRDPYLISLALDILDDCYER